MRWLVHLFWAESEANNTLSLMPGPGQVEACSLCLARPLQIHSNAQASRLAPVKVRYEAEEGLRGAGTRVTRVTRGFRVPCLGIIRRRTTKVPST